MADSLFATASQTLICNILLEKLVIAQNSYQFLSYNSLFFRVIVKFFMIFYPCFK